MATRRKNPKRSKAAKKAASRRKTCKFVNPATNRRCQKLCKPNTPYCGIAKHREWVEKQQKKESAVRTIAGGAFVPIPAAAEEAMPDSWRTAFLGFIASGDLISLRQEIAAARTRQNELLTQLDRGSDGARLEAAATAWKKFRSASMPESMKDHPRQRERIRQLDAILLEEDPEGVTSRYWTAADINRELRLTQGHIGKLVEREARITEREEGWMRVDQAISILAELVEAVETVIVEHDLPPAAIGTIRERLEQVAITKGTWSEAEGQPTN